MTVSYVNVALPVPLHREFTYRVPEALVATCRPGHRVVVPFRRRPRVGVVVATDAVPPVGIECAEVVAVCDPMPVLTDEALTVCRWIARYYAAPLGEVCRAAVPGALWRKPKWPRPPRRIAVHRHEAAAHDEQHITWTAAQAAAVEVMSSAMAAGQFASFLLHGVTGSGKTEVYLAVMAAALARGQGAILLLPEIGLTPQLLGRLTARFGEQVAVYHSGLTDAERVQQWQRLANGEARICCGTRSAVFAPVARLGCLIVDEEHDGSYKQEDEPRYHARDVAIVRAQHANAVAVLGSATPSLESWFNGHRGKSVTLSLPERPHGTELPTIELVDLRTQPTSHDPSGLLSPPLRDAMTAALGRGEQCLLFLNRRGFAAMVQCRACGHVFRCPNCDVSLTLHRQAALLCCHYCELQQPRSALCPGCGSERLKAIGTGTERLEAAIAVHFPAARLARLDKDTGSARQARRRILSAMHAGEVDILIGTQMITKGHDFSRVTMVGVVLADQSLYLPDFRAAERTFQVLTQVAGRAGRSQQPGHVVVQTYTPEHYSLQCAARHDYAAFVAEESQHREALGYPPFGRLLNVRVQGSQATRVEAAAHALTTALRTWAGTTLMLLGPAPAPRERLAGKHRWQCLVKCRTARQIAQCAEWLVQYREARAEPGIHLAIDIDPIHLL